MRVADYIFEKLVQEGVTRPFVVTGRGALFLDDAIAKARGCPILSADGTVELAEAIDM